MDFIDKKGVKTSEKEKKSALVLVEKYNWQVRAVSENNLKIR